MSDENIATVWDFFEKLYDGEQETAKCKLCKDILNCKTTHNLKSHLHCKHSDVVEVPDIKPLPKLTDARTRDFIWSFFTKTDEKGYASCNLCGNTYNYKNTIWNLRSHLCKRHDNVTPTIQEIIEAKDDDSKNDDDLWDYFEEEGSRARCAVCRQVMARSKMREHMQAFHRKLLAAHQDSDDENENFTEVVYLEEDPIPTPKKLRASPKGRPPSTKTSEEYYKTPIRRKSLILEKKRKESSSDEDNDEINKFTKYISCLLKTVPSDLCTKLQLDIVNLIMTAKLKQQESNTKLHDNIVNNQNSPLPVIYTVRSDNIFQEQSNLGTESASLNPSQN